MPYIEIPGGELEEWLSVLKPYQRNHIETFLATDAPEEAAQRWLGATGSPNIVAFGGTPDPKPFWDKYQAEFKKFLCDDEAYVEAKEKLREESPNAKLYFVSVISAAIAATLGLTATVLAAPVSILLFLAAQMGINAYCEND